MCSVPLACVSGFAHSQLSIIMLWWPSVVICSSVVSQLSLSLSLSHSHSLSSFRVSFTRVSFFSFSLMSLILDGRGAACSVVRLFSFNSFRHSTRTVLFFSAALMDGMGILDMQLYPGKDDLSWAHVCPRVLLPL